MDLISLNASLDGIERLYRNQRFDLDDRYSHWQRLTEPKARQDAEAVIRMHWEEMRMTFYNGTQQLYSTWLMKYRPPFNPFKRKDYRERTRLIQFSLARIQEQLDAVNYGIILTLPDDTLWVASINEDPKALFDDMPR